MYNDSRPIRIAPEHNHELFYGERKCVIIIAHASVKIPLHLAVARHEKGRQRQADKQ